eukprot:TRINITY_DN66634_c0_g1_i1.p1 TRINITY_DN66634_c0_g1~~TRINITY_DN66634_c0_g1_i1.p1  ORF type:complete len:199 (+),score=54.95 TRINITY_DN66634_c0_g1_i1:72-599(+)
MAAEAPPGGGGGFPPGAIEDIIAKATSGKHAYTQSFWEDVQAFGHAVDWSQDNWILGILAFEALQLLAVLAWRKHWERLGVLFVTNMIVLLCLESLNSLARRHWKSFSTQQYFDEPGAFAGVIVGLPLLINQFVILVCLLMEAGRMVIKVKRAEFKNSAKSAAKAKAGAESKKAQ